MPWEEYEAALRQNAAHLRADEQAPTGDARLAGACPVCMSRLNWLGRTGDCPLGHYRVET